MAYLHYMKILWTTEAKLSYKQNLRYLKEEWSYKEIENFIQIVEEKTARLMEYPEMGNYDELWKRRKVPIIGPVWMYYFVDKEFIVISYFWNTYKKPRY